MAIGKVCTKCGEWKPLGEFSKDRTKADRLRYQCKTCVKKYRRGYHAANSEKEAARSKTWRGANPEKVIAWREANKEGITARQKAWYEANKEEVAVQRKAHYEANKEEITARNRAYYRANPDKWREAYARRRALKAGAEGGYTRAEFRALCELFGQVCLCCGKSHEESPLTVDHVIPLSKGGSNWISNIQPLCGYCNDSKGTKTIDYRGGGRCNATTVAVECLCEQPAFFLHNPR